MILQRDWCTEHGHDPVTGELINRAAVSFHHGGTRIQELGHQLAQTFGAHRSGDVHRTDNVGEQHRHLLVLRGRL